MKELDVLLQAFLDREQDQLEQGNWPEFEQLLALEDDVIWDWLLDPSTPDARDFQPLLGGILSAT